jgi:transposase InsO family protein
MGASTTTSTTPAQSTAPADKLARQRMSVLELALTLGSVSDACRQRGVSRTQFYEYKRRFQEQGLAGLKDLPPIHKTHPQTTPPEVVDRVLALSLERPGWGCYKLSDYLKLQGVSVSGPTIQGHLAKQGLGTKYARLLRIEEQALEEGLELTPGQVALVEKANPCYRERHVESSRPGELLCQDTYFVGVFKGVGKVYLHSVVDTYGSYAFGFLSAGRVPEAAVAVLHHEVVPFYHERAIPLGAILTDNGRAFCGTDRHPFELYLALSDVEHRRTRVRSPQTNGFVERFHGTIQDEFFQPALRQRFSPTPEDLQLDLDAWLLHYNTERPHRGYRTRGKRPMDTVNDYLTRVRQEG